jgi:DNA helicase II / ATP-dependent DNA helicase PcrA
MPSNSNLAIVAVAGAGKTQTIIDKALADPSRRVFITTYTVQNLRQITQRIEQRTGVIPSHIHLAGWFTFLLRDGIRPYQNAVFDDVGIVRGLGFYAQRNRYTPRAQSQAFYLDGHQDVYRDSLADLACAADGRSGGLVIDRLETLYDQIYVDEIQDLVGYDLEFLDLLFKSKIEVTVVGDPRQHTFSTNRSPKNKKYRGAGLSVWFDERVTYCARENRVHSFRCNQPICEFASSLFPGLDPIESAHDLKSGHDGVFEITKAEVRDYVDQYQPTVLRDSKRSDTLGLQAMNIGVSKGSTFDRVLLFPTKPMRQYLADRNPSKLKEPESLYVAVTRARHSVTFVV